MFKLTQINSIGEKRPRFKSINNDLTVFSPIGSQQSKFTTFKGALKNAIIPPFQRPKLALVNRQGDFEFYSASELNKNKTLGSKHGSSAVIKKESEGPSPHQIVSGIFKNIIEARKKGQSVNIENFGFKATNYYKEYSSRRVKDLSGEKLHSNRPMSINPESKRLLGLFDQLERQFPTTNSFRMKNAQPKSNTEFHKIIKSICDINNQNYVWSRTKTNQSLRTTYSFRPSSDSSSYKKPMKHTLFSSISPVGLEV